MKTPPTNAMTFLAQDPPRRAKMGQAARERYLKLFSPKAVVPLMLETYSRLRLLMASRRSSTRVVIRGELLPFEERSAVCSDRLNRTGSTSVRVMKARTVARFRIHYLRQSGLA